MALNQSKIDVTDRVVGKLKNGEIQLFIENTPIGKIKMSDHIQVELDHHFEAEQQKIYQHVTVTEGRDAKYTDCDDGGWC
ncbi:MULTISPECIES: YusG family protein [Bacillaceae]|uniref:YusG family protein n=1 Tax=Bacillaceae TaxID=186817 RepID=UPI002FFDD00C